MSTYMYVVTEKDYLQFLTEISDDMSFDEIYDGFDMINYETNFSGSSYRLYDVVYELDQFEDEFTEYFDCNGYVTTVEELKKIVEASDKEDLVEKWEPIIERFENESSPLRILVDRW